MSLTSTLALDVLVRPMGAKGLKKLFDLQCVVRYSVRDFQVCLNENCSIYDAEISYTRFSGALKRNHEIVLF